MENLCVTNGWNLGKKIPWKALLNKMFGIVVWKIVWKVVSKVVWKSWVGKVYGEKFTVYCVQYTF